MNFLSRMFTLGLTVGLLSVAYAADGGQRFGNISNYYESTDNGISVLRITDSPNPFTSLDRDILKSSPFIDSTGILFFGSIDGSFRAANIGSRKIDALWEFVTGGEILSSPAVDNDGTLYFGSADKNVYALYPNGTLKWSFATGGPVVSSPALSDDGTLYVGSKDGSLYALNSDGSRKWVYATQGAIYASPALAADGTVYIGSLDGSLYALSPDGELEWTYLTGGAIYSSASISFAGEIIFGSNDFNVCALNPDGTLKWRFATEGEVIATPAIGLDGSVYFGSNDGSLYRIDAAGNLVSESVVGTPIWSSPIVSTSGKIISATCGAYRQYYIEVNNVLEVFSTEKDGRISLRGSGGSADENGKFGFGYTGAFTSAVNGKTIMIAEGFGSFGWHVNYSTFRGYENNTSWPRFHHDSRNTGNVATSLAIPVVDIDMELSTFSCDIDGNGKADLADFFYLLRKIIANQADPSWDIDNSGRINISDAIELLIRIFSNRCNPGSSLLASADFDTGALQSLSAEHRQILLDALVGAELSAEEQELVQAALSGIGAPASLPRAFSLAQNSPNPFNPSTTISYTVPEGKPVPVSLRIFDLRGNLIQTLVNATRAAGTYKVFWDGTDESGRQVASGIYFYRLRAEEFTQTRKMVLLK